MIKTLCLLLLVAILPVRAQEGHLIPSPLRKLPKWVRTEYLAKGLDRQYSIIFSRHPAYLKGDFNADGRKDVAIQIQDKANAMSGIAIFHAKRPQVIATPVTILGAGKTLGKIGDDFQKMDVWELVKRGDVLKSEDVLLHGGDAIKLTKRDSLGGVIYWNGKQYAWKEDSPKRRP